MLVDGRQQTTIWTTPDRAVWIVDQRVLPHRLVTMPLATVADCEVAISDMAVRGAPLIGVTAAFGMALAMRADASDAELARAGKLLIESRPTAVNLAWAVRRMQALLAPLAPRGRAEAAFAEAEAIRQDDIDCCAEIGRHGADVLAALAPSNRPLQVLTHCNAGWLAAVDWGTALAPIYAAQARGIPIHVWVDETRPRNQGASLTAWELGQQGVAHTVIVDNAGGHLMQHGMVDVCIVGSDRVAANGDLCNKIGTYLKALAAEDNGIPFYGAMPHSTIDWHLDEGRNIPIEQRDGREVTHISGVDAYGNAVSVQLTPKGSPAANFAFDVTPARLVTGLITERGCVPATREGLLSLYGERDPSMANENELPADA